ncbi:MAG: response regulator [Betaproteobacteria bacterium]|nr:response regulator [Betaproteobacteria bacterium]
MQPKRILLAEDDPNDRELTVTALQEYRLSNELIAVKDGAEALDYLLRRGQYAGLPPGNPAVALVDLKMPRMGGLEVLREIRATPSLRMLPVVILTSSKEEADVADSYGLGANAYVVKPVDFHDFVDAIKTAGLFWAVLNEPPPGTVAP